MPDPRYPIGKFSYAGPLTAEQKQQCLTDIEQTPARLRTVLRGLSDQQLETPYRDGGWTPRQVAHHDAGLSGTSSWRCATVSMMRCMRRPNSNVRKAMNSPCVRPMRPTIVAGTGASRMSAAAVTTA